MDFKWIDFLIKWILNELDHKKNGLDHKNWIFCPPLILGGKIIHQIFIYLTIITTII